MEAFLIIIGIILIIVGIIGCIIPALPGPPIAYFALVLLQFAEASPFSWMFMLSYLLIVVLVMLLDFYVPIWGTKKFGGSKYGSWGSVVGLIIGLFIPPWGIIVGPFLGAFTGELIGGQNKENALRAGFGAFIGFIAGTLMKLGLTIVIAYYFISESWGIISTWFS
ncbi:MAG: DUF456 domain-containing protein [Bacteroidetes bacterium]|nr:MAG: DUF456 domain-containing protein [Bacteroidota bacterium]